VIGRTGQPESDSQNWTGRTGQAKLDRQNWTGMTRLAEKTPGEQGCQEKITRISQPREDRMERTAGTRQLKQDM
jgi:hypothetical protein